MPRAMNRDRFPHEADEAKLACEIYKYLAVDGRRNPKSIRRIALRIAFLEPHEHEERHAKDDARGW